jgi:hypothetical protein
MLSESYNNRKWMETVLLPLPGEVKYYAQENACQVLSLKGCEGMRIGMKDHPEMIRSFRFSYHVAVGFIWLFLHQTSPSYELMASGQAVESETRSLPLFPPFLPAFAGPCCIASFRFSEHSYSVCRRVANLSNETSEPLVCVTDTQTHYRVQGVGTHLQSANCPPFLRETLRPSDNLCSWNLTTNNVPLERAFTLTVFSFPLPHPDRSSLTTSNPVPSNRATQFW